MKAILPSRRFIASSLADHPRCPQFRIMMPRPAAKKDRKYGN
jgi:hypothetical protein